MAGGKRPDYRIVAKSRSDGSTREVAIGWSNEYGGVNIRAHTEESENKMALADALNPEEYFLNMWPNKPREEEAEDDRPRRRKRVSRPEPETADEDF